MITTILISVGCFLMGVLVGARGYYLHMDSIWQRYPYQFKYIFERRLARLVKEGKLQPLESEQ